MPWSSPSNQSSNNAIGYAIGYMAYIKHSTKGENIEPTCNPKRTQIDCGMISPKMTISTVLITTACQPPPRHRSNTIGKVSFVITFDNSRVTSTQCLPRFKRFNTRSAWYFSRGEPLVCITFKYTSSWPIKPNVSPAKIPPSITNTIEIDKNVLNDDSFSTAFSDERAISTELLNKGNESTRGTTKISPEYLGSVILQGAYSMRGEVQILSECVRCARSCRCFCTDV